MCGLCGLIGLGLEKENFTAAMLRSMRHRGPDDSGTWRDGPVSLGHNRLSIIDLTPRGRQPMTRGDLVIILNGEIYNYLELKSELQVKYGQAFYTETDTEVVLAAWQVWRQDALTRFRGMWAFALYDSAAKELILSRDRFGVKPLYYFEDGEKFIFASEIKALLTVPGVPRRAFLPVVSDYLLAGLQDHRPETFFAGIKQLPPGHCLYLDVSKRTHTLQPYYRLSSRIEGRISTIEDFSRAFESSVKLHLRSDVPVGVCLSGGLDSSAVATLAAADMREQERGVLHAVTAQSGDSIGDETDYARRVVEASGLKWHLATPTEEDFQAEWGQCLRHQDEPTGGPSVFMQYCVMKQAKEAGLKVMLDGQGGDECLLGYERYYPAVLYHRLSKGALIRAVREYAATTRCSNLNGRQLALYCAYFLSPQIRKRRLANRLRGFPPELVRGTLATVEESARTYRDIRAMQAAEIGCYQLPHLLRYADRNSMAWSVESRVPFVDHEVVETALTLQPEEKINNGYTKWALRKIMDQRMPDEITWRRNKIAFAAPVERWNRPAELMMKDAIGRSPILREMGVTQAPQELRRLISMYELSYWESLYEISL